MGGSDVVLYERRGPSAWITLNRPEKLNALSYAVVDALEAAIDRAEADDEVRVVVVRGAGRAFSAGYDLEQEASEDHEPTAAEWHAVLGRDVEVTMRLWALPKPTIAAVHGWCLAGGMEVAMACDLLVASDDARFGEPEIRYGSGPVTLLMPYVLGERRTRELLLTGDTIDAATALDWGLANRVVPREALEATVDELVARIAPTPLAVLRLTKKALNRAQQAMGLLEAVEANLDLSAMLNGARAPEQQEFDRIVREQGLKAALRWRDARYDQILGDVSRGDGDRKLSLFGRAVTPNFHALVDRFPLLDHVFANSEASIDGHFWASAGAVSDYVHKNWFQNYADRKRPYDFGVYGVTWPGSGFLFDQAERQKISYFNYGEAVAGVVPKKIIPDKDVPVSSPAGQLVERKFEKSDLGNPFGCYPNDAYIGRNAISGNPVWDTKLPAGAESKAESRYECFEKRFQSQLAANAVPRFTYLTLTSDHTNGTDPGRRTPKAMIADNDDALGRIVDLVSHSKIWRQSAIFVIEDDSQDGADHVDAHRIPAAVISPFAKRRAVIHTRYDFLSVIRSMELILGMRPLGLADRLATPMYDAFDTSARNAAPYALVPPQVDLLARNPATAANARLSHSLNLDKPDQVTQHVLDRILWQSVHGRKAAPPPPGPNAVAERDADG